MSGIDKYENCYFFLNAGWEFASFVFEKDPSIQGAEETLFGRIAHPYFTEPIKISSFQNLVFW